MHRTEVETHILLCSGLLCRGMSRGITVYYAKGLGRVDQGCDGLERWAWHRGVWLCLTGHAGWIHRGYRNENIQHCHLGYFDYQFREE